MRIPPMWALWACTLVPFALLGACDGQSDQALLQVVQAPQEKGGGLQFRLTEGQDQARPNYHDFGTVPEGSILQHAFILENTDPRPVEVQKIDPACGCTVARLGKELPDGSLEPAISDQPNRLMVLAPGEAMHVALTVDSDEVRQKNRDKLFMVRITTDSVTNPFITLECHLIVRQHFQVAPEAIDLGDVPIGGGGEGLVTIKSIGPIFHQLVDLGPVPDGVFAQLEVNPMTTDDFYIWTLKAGFEAPMEAGRKAAEIRIRTVDSEGQPAPDLVVNLTATATEDIRVYPPKLVLRPAPKGGNSVVHAELAAHLAGQRLNVIGYSILGSSADDLTVTAQAFQPMPDGTSSRWDISLETRTTPRESSFSGTIVLELDDPSTPRLEIPYVGLGF